jgi:hypothetical protein
MMQKWVLHELASQWSMSSNVNVCPHTIFSRSSVLRYKPTNLLPLGFEVQTKKHSQWFWGLNHQTIDLSFEAQTKKLSQWCWGQTNNQTVVTGFEAKLENLCFSYPPCVWCRSHTPSPNLPIVWPPSTLLVPDDSQSSTPSLLLLPRTSSLPTISH